MRLFIKRWYALTVALLLAGTLAAAPFELLFRILTPAGPCEVLRPDSDKYEAVRKGFAYPYGSTVRCGEGGSALIVLSDKDAIKLEANTLVELHSSATNEQHKILRLRRGNLLTRMDVSNEDEYALTIDSGIAKCVALNGSGTFKLTETPTDLVFTAQSDGSSTFRLIGPQFVIPSLRNGYGARITTAHDNSVSRIDNLLGDYRILVNSGLREDAPEMIDDEPNPELIRVDTNSRSTLKIWRTHAKVGGRLIVSVLATDAHGKGRENFAFAVGQPTVASRSHFADDEPTTNLLGNALAPFEEGANGDEPAAEGVPELPAFDFNAF